MATKTRFKRTSKTNTEALNRAQSGQSLDNDIAVLSYFGSIGLSDIRPRQNVLSYSAWQAIGRQVAKNARGCKLVTMIPKKDKSGKISYMFRKSVGVFHELQTIPAGTEEVAQGADISQLWHDKE